MGERKYHSPYKEKEKTKGEEVMTTPQFILDNQDLHEKIIKIVRKHDGNFTAMQDDFETTQLIMKEVEKWQELDKSGGAIKEGSRPAYLKPHSETIIKRGKKTNDLERS